MLSVGRCGVARLQMKFEHMDGMHCSIDGTTILVKIKSVALYNCQTIYIYICVCVLYTYPTHIKTLINVTLASYRGPDREENTL